ncbi:hypothetical protein DFQ30_007640 [Apophysomyces sp. BC1015]|nr:hypothetical protein DFQ30_007640 [Apophysomyces sp. BC1015]
MSHHINLPIDLRPELIEVLGKWEHLTRISEVELYKPLDLSSSIFQKQITRLRLGLENHPVWLDLMARLAYIEELNLCFDFPTPKGVEGRVSLSDLNKLHNSLPHLRLLVLEEVSMYGEMPEYITPCDTVRDLRITPLDDRLWSEYFARKYTNLKTLALTIWTGDEFIATTMKLLESCQHLERFYCPHSFSEVMYPAAYQTLHEIGAPMTHLNFGNWDTIPYEAVVNNFRRTVSSITYFASRKDDLTTSDELVKPLKDCLSLMDLNLDCETCQMEVDLAFLLGHCQSLKTLRIAGQIICVSNYDTVNDRHNLRTLNMTAKDIEDGVFIYLSQRCSRLSNLNCFYLSDNNRNYTISFPSPSLKYLSILYTHDALIKLTQTGKTESIVKRNIQYHGPVDGQKTKRWMRWYRTHWKDYLANLRRVKQWEDYENSCQLAKDDKGDTERAFQEKQYPKIPHMKPGTCSVSIQCHSVDIVRLQNVSLITI